MSAATEADARSAAAAGGAGLVPSKTSGDEVVLLLSPSACAERRVARLKRSVWASGHLHGIAERGARPAVCWFVTLTYRGVSDWRPDHISVAIRRFREWCKVKAVACRYTWVAELQTRGAVHYHLLAWLPVGVRMPQWDRAPARRRAAFWMHGMTNTQPAKAGVGYLMKYLSKLGELTRFPKGLRLYGIGGLDEQARAVRQWFNLPQWARCEFGVSELVRRKGALVVRATGEILSAVWSVQVVPGALKLRALRAVVPRLAGTSGLEVATRPGAFSAWPVAA